jgi:tRNA pseudouridine55 synthase
MSGTHRPSREQRYDGRPAPLSPLDGVLLVNKPAGPTSHDVVYKIRKRFKIKKVGHGGTLDPQATGLLVILLGKGTKLSNSFLSSDKAYTGTMKLGMESDSHDAFGKILKESPCSAVSEEQVASEMRALKGDSFQTPPMVSAIKVNGVPLYKKARKGETVERTPRFIHIYEFSPTRIELPEIDFTVTCTKGTYIRTLCHDLGASLGCGAVMTALTRTASGSFTLDNALELDDILQMNRDELKKAVRPISDFT